METSTQARPTGLAADEKATPVMIYTQNSLVRGFAITKESIRINIWLRTVGVPEYIHVKNAQVVVFGGGAIQPMSFTEYYVPTPQVIAFHSLPPVNEPPDYEETEKNRKMEPITALVGVFRFNSLMRMSVQMTLGSNLDVTRISFLSLYDNEISSPFLPGMGTLKIPMAVMRPNAVHFGTR